MLKKIAEELSVYSPSELASIVIVLPTQRLAVHLLGQLEQNHKVRSDLVFQAPQMFTLENFVRWACEKEKAPSATVLADASLENLLSMLIEEGSYVHLRKGHEHEIKQFFSLIEESGFENKAFQKLQEVMAQDIHHSEVSVSGIYQRILELERLYAQLNRMLKEKNLKTYMTFCKDSAVFLQQTWVQQSELSHKLYFACFTTVKGPFVDLLKYLSRRSEVCFYLSAAPELLGDVNPLADLLAILRADTSKTNSRVKEIPLPLDPRSCHIVELAQPYQEMQWAMTVLKQKLASGVPPHEIAILLSDEQVYGKLIRQSLNAEGIEANVAIPLPFSHTLMGNFILGLCDFFSTSKGSWTQLLNHSFWRRSFNRLSYRSLSSEMLGFELSFFSDEDDLARMLLRTQNDKFKHYLEFISKKIEFFSQAIFTRAQLSLSHWAQNFQEHFRSFLEKEIEHISPDSRTSQALALNAFFQSLQEISLAINSVLTCSQFFALLRTVLRSLDARHIGYPMQGVQVVNLVEARYVPFQTVLLLGCNEGLFPKSLPKDHLIDDWLKTQIGLSGWKYIEALEDTTFHLIYSQSHELYMSYSIDSRPRSRFVERLLSQKKIRLENFSLPLAKTDVFAPVPSCKGRFVPDRQVLFESVSATSLSYLLNCPYRFLLHKLAVKDFDLLKTQPSILEGQWLHAILESFYTGIYDGAQIVEPLPAKIVLRSCEFMEFTVARLTQLTEAILPKALRASALYQHLVHFSWPKFAEHWQTFFSSDESKDEWIWECKKHHQELAFGDARKGYPSVSIKMKTFPDPIQIHGVIDSLLELEDRYVLTDYKRKSMDSLSDMQKGLSPQLLLYALAYSLFDEQASKGPKFEQGVIGYYSVLKGLWQGRGVGDASRAWAQDKKLVTKSTPSLSLMMDRFLAEWEQRLEEFYRDQKDFIPKPGDHCQFCSYMGICRKEDPSHCF